MNPVVVIIVLCSATVRAVVLMELFSGTPVTVRNYSTSLSLGNVSQKYQDLLPDDLKASNTSAMLAELLRRMFGVGIYPLPPLDPYRNKKHNGFYIGNDSIMTGDVNFSSLRITGAKKFELDSLEIRTKTGRIDFHVKIPSLNLTTTFLTDLRFGQLIPVMLTGELSIELDGYQMAGALQTSTRRLTGFGSKLVHQVTGAKFHIQANESKVQFKKMQLENDLLESLDSVKGDPAMAAWMTKLISLEEQHLLNTFLSELNTILKGLTVYQVKAFLLPEDDV